MLDSRSNMQYHYSIILRNPLKDNAKTTEEILSSSYNLDHEVIAL